MSLDEEILAAATQYMALQEEAKQLVKRADLDERLIEGAPSTIRLKKSGTRNLTELDVEQLINRYGTPTQKELVEKFPQLRDEFSKRLKETKHLRLVLERAEIPYQNYFARMREEMPEREIKPGKPRLAQNEGKPDRKAVKWKAQEMVKLMEIINQLGL